MAIRVAVKASADSGLTVLVSRVDSLLISFSFVVMFDSRSRHY